MKLIGSMSAPRVFCVFFALLLPLSVQMHACKKQSQDSVVTETSTLNGGFRILPTQAARDDMRPKVIYRCNEVRCGEAFQPSNEERDVVIPCDLDKINFPSGTLPPYYRTVTERGVRQLIVNAQHQTMCKDPRPFTSVVASTPVVASPASATGCQKFRSSQADCKQAEAEGCRWVSHPSGREPMGRKGDCVGLTMGGAATSGLNNSELFQVDKSPVGWAPLESYRAAP